jgi:hypothetical protein
MCESATAKSAGLIRAFSDSFWQNNLSLVAPPQAKREMALNRHGDALAPGDGGHRARTSVKERSINETACSTEKGRLISSQQP